MIVLISPDNANGIADIKSEFWVRKAILSGRENPTFRGRRAEKGRRLPKFITIQSEDLM